MDKPTYAELREEVAEKVYDISKAEFVDQINRHTDDVMNALGEAYALGVKDQIERTSKILSGDPQRKMINPYRWNDYV